MSRDALIVLLVCGVIAGWLASWIVGGGGLITYLVSGVIGSFVGGALLNFLGVDLGIKNPTLRFVVTATIGAIVVIVLARLIT
jgi:uncharacterized membrane protein YeaQ/YmgE (transglycosylase-associated protein family)